MKGILVGSNARQEWLLPWWWERYCRHNRYPVTFADFGLSQEKKKWCQERGSLLSICKSPFFVKDRNDVEGRFVEEWESKYPDTFWESRDAWFKKPQACLQTPYEQTIWLDIDCEVVQPLDDLFSFGIGLAVDSIASAQSVDFLIYNSGVISFQKNHPLIVEWATLSFEKNGCFRGDQDLLSHIIAEK
ncbi:MAG TPA: hypothetical protein VJK48_05475, partial [Chlamydiales bacterium]|nr:hypothetical protein [Chlamydiales bacterium]